MAAIPASAASLHRKSLPRACGGSLSPSHLFSFPFLVPFPNLHPRFTFVIPAHKSGRELRLALGRGCPTIDAGAAEAYGSLWQHRRWSSQLPQETAPRHEHPSSSFPRRIALYQRAPRVPRSRCLHPPPLPQCSSTRLRMNRLQLLSSYGHLFVSVFLVFSQQYLCFLLLSCSHFTLLLSEQGLDL